MTAIPGTDGYAENAATLVPQYEAIAFEAKHAAVMHLLPAAPARVIDIGAGTGADAAWFAARGHAVVAVEPTDALREPGRALHPSPAIEWIADGLPSLVSLRERERSFDLVMLTAVWMHLDRGERAQAMPRVAMLVAPRGRLLLTLRHGPIPAGRRMFEVTAEETVRLAQTWGLRPLLEVSTASVQATNVASGVTWTCLAFERDG